MSPLRTIQHLADGLHEGVGSFDVPVQVADVGLDSLLLHLADGWSHVDGGDFFNPLPGIGAQVKVFWAVVCFQIAVCRVRPSLPPDFGILLVVPVHGVLLVAFPSAGREPDSFAVPVKVIYLAAFGEPFPFFVHRPHGEQDMGVGVPVPLVVDGKVGNHALGNKKTPGSSHG